jgi:hypothetical protein
VYAVRDRGEAAARPQLSDIRIRMAIRAVISWVGRFLETGSAALRKMGGHKLKEIAGEYRLRLWGRNKEKDFILRGFVAERGRAP